MKQPTREEIAAKWLDRAWVEGYRHNVKFWNAHISKAAQMLRELGATPKKGRKK